MTFRVGQKVVCVDAKIPLLAQFLRAVFNLDWPLVEGEVYTVKRLTVLFDEPAIELAEVKNAELLDGLFRQARFRPIVERETDISFAHEILRKNTKKAPSKESAIT